MLRITLVLFLVGEALAQIDLKVRCPTVRAVANFNLTAYSGLWYEQAKYAVESEVTTKCVTAIHIPLQGGAFSIINTKSPLYGGDWYNIEYIATPVGKTHDGVFTLPSGAPYDVLRTDYNFWALAWSCAFHGEISTHDARILTRKRNPSQRLLNQIWQSVRSTGVNKRLFINTIKTGCPAAYYYNGN